MKLLSLHVENFGTLHDLDEQFNDGLNVRLHPNGYGKSTLAVFIKSMLYGLPASTRRSLIENERKRYTPWQGGVFGGSLDFEVGGEPYRIERTFGAKEADDTLSVLSLRTGEVVQEDWATTPGESLLGVGIAAYERSTYLSQRPDELTRDGMASIHQKLNRLADEADDLGRFDAAMTALDRRRQYYALMGRRGGAIADTEESIAALDSRLADCRAASEALDHSRERAEHARQMIAQARTALDELDSRERELHRVREHRAVSERLEALRREEGALREQIETMRHSLGGIVPTKQTVETLETALRTRDELRARLTTQAMSERETAELGELRARHGMTPPSPETLDELRTCAEQYHRATVDAIAVDAYLASPERMGRSHEQIRSDCERICASEQQRHAALLEQKETLCARLTARRMPLVPFVLVVLSVALTMGGLLTPLLWAIGGGLLAVSLAVLLIGIARQSARGRDDEARLVGINHDLSHAEQRLQGVRLSLTAAEQGTRFAALWHNVCASTPCPMGLHAPQGTQQLVTDSMRLRELTAREQEIQTACAKTAEELERVETTVRELLAPMKDAPDDDRRALLWLTELRSRLVDCSERYVQKKDELRALCDQHGIREDERPVEPSVTDCSTDEQAIRHERERLQGELETWAETLARELQNGERLMSASEGETEAESERERLVSVLTEQKTTLDAILNAQTYLSKARENLSGRYLATVKERFGYYMSCLTGTDTPEFTMDGQFHVKLRASGRGRTAEEFSVGQRDLIALCERLALLDAMFEGERPFLMLDDPFTNMDDDTVSRGHALLRAVSERYQLLYLTCHTGRIPGEP